MPRFRATLTVEGGGDPVVLEEDVTAPSLFDALEPCVERLEAAAVAAGFEPGSGARTVTATRLAFEIRKLGA